MSELQTMEDAELQKIMDEFRDSTDLVGSIVRVVGCTRPLAVSICKQDSIKDLIMDRLRELRVIELSEIVILKRQTEIMNGPMTTAAERKVCLDASVAVSKMMGYDKTKIEIETKLSGLSDEALAQIVEGVHEEIGTIEAEAETGGGSGFRTETQVD